MTPLQTAVVLGTRRSGSMSQLVARAVLEQFDHFPNVRIELLDLAMLEVPIFESRTEDNYAALPDVRFLCEALQVADAVLFVAPEYKNGYPGALKNALDYLPPRVFRRKPIGIISVSSGPNGGLNCLAQLRQVCFGLGGLPIPEQVLVSNVTALFDEQGGLRDPNFAKQVRTFLEEFL